MSDVLTWDDLEYSLDLHLGSMSEDKSFILFVDESGRDGFDPDFDDHPRYVQFCAYGHGMLRCEVVSNAYLPEDMKHDVDALVALRTAGWQLPGEVQTEVGDSGSPNIFLDLPVGDSAAAAAAAMAVFRTIWQVREPHDIILNAEDLRGPHAFRVLSRPNGPTE